MSYQKEPEDHSHLVEANEYWNTKTEEFEVLKRHGLYDIQETFLTPEGKVLFLAYNGYAAQPYAVGIYKSDHGVYWTDPDTARKHYAQRIAEAHGLAVRPVNSWVITDVDRIALARLVNEVALIAESLDESGQLGETGEELTAAVTKLKTHLKAVGIRLRAGE